MVHEKREQFWSLETLPGVAIWVLDWPPLGYAFTTSRRFRRSFGWLGCWWGLSVVAARVARDG